MNWDAIGAVGEILGALAVTVTLIYLSFQVRESRKSAIAEGTSKGVELHSNWRTMYLQNSELAEMLTKANAGESLSEKEKSQLHFLAHELFIASAFSHTFGKQFGSTYVEDGNAIYLIGILRSNPALATEWSKFTTYADIVSVEYRELIDRALRESLTRDIAGDT